MKWFDNNRIRLIIAGFITVIALSGTEFANGTVITVGPEASCNFDTIQAGIDAANDADTVLVAPGEYAITEPITFRGKAITVRSEAGRDETTIQMGTPVNPNRGSVVIFENNEMAASVLDGFTITGSRTGSWIPSEGGWAGGGILFDASSGTVRNCAIVQNRTENGGGVFAWDGASVTMTDCIVRNNSAACAGGLFCMSNSSVTMTDCIIVGNTAETYTCGGVKCWRNSSLNLTNCIIIKNSTRDAGGGAECWGSSMVLTNCTITGNSAESEGGGVFCGEGSVMITNSIIWSNTSPKGPEISAWPGARYTLTYSNVAGGQAEVDVQGGTLNWSEGNIDADPLFVELGYWADINDPNIMVEPDDPNAIWVDGDYHLKSEAGRWDPYSESWVMDDVTSPCIDRGDPHSPVGDEPDPNGGRINMGAYGGTTEASMSIGQLPPLPPPKPIAHWKLDEIEGGIAHDSAGVNDGILYGGPLWQPTAGQIDGALAFDGIDDYVNTDPVLNPANGMFSVVTWIMGDVPGQVIISQAGCSNLLCTDSVEGCFMTELKASSRGAPGPLLSQTSITDSQWHRIALVWDGSYRYLYVDGAEVATDPTPLTELESAEGSLYFGVGSMLTSGTFFSGLIDDVRIYNRIVIP